MSAGHEFMEGEASRSQPCDAPVEHVPEQVTYGRRHPAESDTDGQ